MIDKVAFADPGGIRPGPGLLESMWRFRRMCLMIILGCLCGGAVVARVLPELRSKEAVATAQVGLLNPRLLGSLFQGTGSADELSRYVQERAVVARSTRVLQAAGSQLPEHLASPARLGRQLETSVPPSGTVLYISVRAPGARDAVAVADAIAGAYRQISEDEVQAAVGEALGAVSAARSRLLTTIGSTQAGVASDVSAAQKSAAAQALSQLEIRENEIAISAAAFGSGIKFIDPARAASVNAGVGSLTTIAVMGMLGFLLAMALAWIRADRYDAVHDSGEAEAVIGAPLFGEIPDLESHREGRAKLTQIQAMPADPYQFVATSLRSATQSSVSNLILITSPSRRDGRSVSAANIAAAAARDGRRVVLVDGDSRTKGLTTLAGVAASEPGLTDMLLGRVQRVATPVHVRLSGGSGLDFIPAGTSSDDGASLYRTQAMEEAVHWLRSSYDLVVMDSPPLLGVADAASLATHADAILAVVRKGTRVRLLHTTRQRLDLLPVPLLGYVFIGKLLGQNPLLPTLRPASLAPVRRTETVAPPQAQSNGQRPSVSEDPQPDAAELPPKA